MTPGECIGPDDSRVEWRSRKNRALVALGADGLHYVFLPAYGGGFGWTYAYKTLARARTEARLTVRALLEAQEAR